MRHYKIRTFLFLVLSISLMSCKKEFIASDFPDIPGDYEWIYSEIEPAEFLTSATSTDKYGIRILENDKIRYYKNGKRETTHKILGIFPPSFTADPHILCENKKGETYKIRYYDDKLKLGPVPVSNKALPSPDYGETLYKKK